MLCWARENTYGCTDCTPGQDGIVQDYAVKAGKLQLETERVARMACETRVSTCDFSQLVDITYSVTHLRS